MIDCNSVKLTFSSKNFRPLGKLGCNAKVCNALHNLVWINNKCISQNNSIHFLANTHSRKIRCKKTSNKFNQLCFKDRKSTKKYEFQFTFLSNTYICFEHFQNYFSDAFFLDFKRILNISCF